MSTNIGTFLLFLGGFLLFAQIGLLTNKSYNYDSE